MKRIRTTNRSASGGGTIIIEVPVPVDNSEVLNERLQYDLPEEHTVPEDDTSIDAEIEETSPTPVEEGILGVLLDAFEDHTAPQEDVTGTEAIVVTDEDHPVAYDSEIGVDTFVEESHPIPQDDVAGVVAVLDESLPVPVEDVTDTEAIIVADENSPAPTHTTEIDTEIGESYPTPTDVTTIEVDVSFLWPNAVVAAGGWSSTGNMTDKNTGTNAECSATSSGALGTGGTEESTSSSFQVSVLDPELDDLTIDNAELSWSIGAETSGIQLTAGRCEIDYQYSLDNGSNWATFFAQTAQNGSTSTLDLTTTVGGDWQKIKDMRFRASGTVFSGTGLLPVTTTATWAYARLRILASKDYT